MSARSINERVLAAKKRNPVNTHGIKGMRAFRIEQIRELADTGMSARAIAEEIKVGEPYVRDLCNEEGITLAANIVRNTRRVKSDRVVQEGVHALEGLAMGFDLVDVGELDAAQIEEWATSLKTSVHAVNRLITKMMKEVARG